MKKNSTRDSIILGFTIFAIFFGAGNLIFPPQIGLVSGSNVLAGVLGMTLTGILLPMMAVAAVGNMGSGLQDITKHINSWWHILYMVLGLLIILFGTIPRCGGVAYEIGILGIFPNLPAWSKWAFLIVFFGLSYYLVNNKSEVVDKIGKYLTPFLLVFLIIIVILAFVNPIGKASGGSVENPFANALLTAYNTGDVGTGLVCAGIFLSAIKKKGYIEEKERKNVLYKAITIAFVLLFIIYGGMCYMGATGNALFSADTDNTTLLVGLVRKLAGYGGVVILSLAIIIACFTTAVGMIATSAEWIEELSKGKWNYKVIAAVVTTIIFLMASTGVNFVLKVSGPIFAFTYPMSIIMTILGVFKKSVPNDGAWKGSIYMATLLSTYDAFSVARANGLISLQTPALDNLIMKIPLAGYGFAWIVPSVLGFIVGAVIWKSMGKHDVGVEERI